MCALAAFRYFVSVRSNFDRFSEVLLAAEFEQPLPTGRTFRDRKLNAALSNSNKLAALLCSLIRASVGQASVTYPVDNIHNKLALQLTMLSYLARLLAYQS